MSLKGEKRLEASEFNNKTHKILTRLGLNLWQVYWIPDSSFTIRGRAVPEKHVIEIYDIDEEAAWDTFLHEVIEIKLRSTLRPYRILVNKLIECIQEIADTEKDLFIESLNVVFEVAQDSPPSS